MFSVYRKRIRLLPGMFLLITLGVFAGCASRPHGAMSEEAAAGEIDVKAEAYLFDARLHRNGKMNTFRLEVFQTDSVLGLGGRGYLGKGILKGRMTRDSLEAYFPTANEWVYASIGELLESTDCPVTVPNLNLISFFVTLPDSVELPSDIVVESDYGDPDRPTFSLHMNKCPWEIQIIYDRRDTGWRIREFYFTDGESNDLRAKRREYRADATVGSDKFTVSIPPDARRIIP